MSLPNDVARCPGQPRKAKDGEWPFPSQEPYCVDCARRRAGIADYVSGARVVWMDAPTERPCTMRLEVTK